MSSWIEVRGVIVLKKDCELMKEIRGCYGNEINNLTTTIGEYHYNSETEEFYNSVIEYTKDCSGMFFFDREMLEDIKNEIDVNDEFNSMWNDIMSFFDSIKEYEAVRVVLIN
jgi:hypothetical protein